MFLEINDNLTRHSMLINMRIFQLEYCFKICIGFDYFLSNCVYVVYRVFSVESLTEITKTRVQTVISLESSGNSFIPDGIVSNLRGA